MKWILRDLFTFITVLMLSACSGSGGSDSGSGGNLYSGNTGAAILTADNDDAFGTLMLEGSATSKTAGGASPFSADTVTEKKNMGHIEVLLNKLVDVAQQQVQTAASEKVTAKAIDTNGTCPSPAGSFTITPPTTGTSSPFTYTISFNNYCLGDLTYSTTMNGSMTMKVYFAGALSVSTITKVEIAYENLTVSNTVGSTTYSSTFSGTTILDYDGFTYPTPNSVSNTVYFGRDGKIYKITDINISSLGNISGRFYHPVHGYVDITTESTFDRNLTTGEYCGGTLRIAGKTAGGSDIATTIAVSADCATYTICYDVDSGGTCTNNVPWH